MATALLEACRRVGCTLILVGHVTKDGVLAGPRLLEHMVDTVISLEGDRRQMFRLLRVFKNRFGPNEELLVFRMGERGMQVVDDPSTFFWARATLPVRHGRGHGRGRTAPPGRGSPGSGGAHFSEHSTPRRAGL